MDKQATDFEKNIEAINNSLAAFTSNVTGVFNTSQLSKQDTLYKNTNWNLISNNRNLLSQIYVEHGIVQTLVDQPVDDAFRTGFEIKTGQLDGEEIEQLQVYMERNHVIRELMQGTKWARLYGGGGVMIITNEDPAIPLDISRLKKGQRVAFKSFDMWEMYANIINTQGESTLSEGERLDDFKGDFFDYYGKKIHRSRVLRINGKEAPAFIKPRLRGWGMAEVERCIRDMNQYLKNQDVIFELLDEAKVDVYKMKGFNTALMTAEGTNRVSTRVQHANSVKNFQNAITMDMDDDYQQKQVSFAGLGEILTQIRQGIAASLKMPMTKLFGISSAGFNSGEDDIENYNSMVEGEIRSKAKHPLIELIKVCCQVEFGIVPDDLMVKFFPLRVMSAEQEETIKGKQFERTMSAFERGLASAQETKAAINKNSLLPVELDESTDALDTTDDFSDNSGEGAIGG